jgi:FKBP-type peptidyl-prolyl cis-trans isomerase
MNINRSYLLFILSILIIFVSSCSSGDYRTGETGYKYKIVRDRGGPTFINNHYILMNMDYYYENDSLLFTSAEKNVPVSMQYNDTIWDRRGQIYHGLKKLKVGDSALFRVNCSELYEVSFRGEIPYGLNPNAKITFHVGITDMLNATEFRMWQANLYMVRQEEIKEKTEQQLFEDISIIDFYLEESGIIAMELESGIRYIIQEPGNGIKPEKGDKVVLHYTGYLLDGTKFDSSYDKNDPFEFKLGIGRVIPGWEESIAEMSIGSKYILYVPSTMAYGEKGLGNMIEPNSIIVFELELLDIKKKGN